MIVGSMDAVPRKQYTDLDDLLQRKYYSKAPFEPLEKIKYYDFWRLFYTAFSRAQNLLLLTCQEKTQGRRVPSRYFQPVYDQACPWRNGAFQSERLTLEIIKDVDLKNEYSFTSHITVFENCARQYKFYRDLGFAPIRRNPILFGTLVHQTIEDIHKAVLHGEEQKVTDQQISDCFHANYTHLSRQERLYLSSGGQQAALDHVLNYAHRERRTWDRLRETEVEVSFVKDTYLLKGHVDLIRGEEGTVEIVDLNRKGSPTSLVSGRRWTAIAVNLKSMPISSKDVRVKRLVRCTSTTPAKMIAIRISALTRMRARLIRRWRYLMAWLIASKIKTLKSRPVRTDCVGTAI